MTSVEEGNLRRTFPDGWLVTHYDRWAFLARFTSACGGNKAVDVLGLDPSSHRRHRSAAREFSLVGGVHWWRGIMKPWREVAVPHKDVQRGTFQQSEFAADLSAVRAKRATPEYQDAAQFFERTFISEGAGSSMMRCSWSSRGWPRSSRRLRAPYE